MHLKQAESRLRQRHVRAIRAGLADGWFVVIDITNLAQRLKHRCNIFRCMRIIMTLKSEIYQFYVAFRWREIAFISEPFFIWILWLIRLDVDGDPQILGLVAVYAECQRAVGWFVRSRFWIARPVFALAISLLSFLQPSGSLIPCGFLVNLLALPKHQETDLLLMISQAIHAAVFQECVYDAVNGGVTSLRHFWNSENRKPVNLVLIYNGDALGVRNEAHLALLGVGCSMVVVVGVCVDAAGQNFPRVFTHLTTSLAGMPTACPRGLNLCWTAIRWLKIPFCGLTRSRNWAITFLFTWNLHTVATGVGGQRTLYIHIRSKL